jgi:hypothetical protein
VVAELAGYAGEYEAAAGRGDPWAHERLLAVRSWTDMIGAARGDAVVADLFLEFARGDRAVWLGLRGGVA